MSCDLLSLLLQAVGGALAAFSHTPSGSALGGNIMLAGIVFQVATFTFLYVLVIIFVINFRRNRTTVGIEAEMMIGGK